MYKERSHIKVFVSSTVYDFESQLDMVYSTLDGYGYDVMMSHKGTIPLDSKLSNLENCLNARATEFISRMKAGSTFSKQDYLQYWNHKISDPTTKNDIQQLVSSQLCRKDGSGPTTKYVVLANI